MITTVYEITNQDGAVVIRKYQARSQRALILHATIIYSQQDVKALVVCDRQGRIWFDNAKPAGSTAGLQSFQGDRKDTT